MELYATVADKRYIAEWEKLPESSKERVLRYGWQRIINDRAGGKDKTVEQKHEDAQKMYDALLSGTMPTRGNGGVDPLTIESRRLALKAWLGTKDKAKADDRAAKYKVMEKAERDETADKIIAAQNDEWRSGLEAAAKAEVERKAAEKLAKQKAVAKVSATVDVDL